MKFSFFKILGKNELALGCKHWGGGGGGGGGGRFGAKLTTSVTYDRTYHFSHR